MTLPDQCVYQCPLCQSWQMDYSVKMMLDEFGEWGVNLVTGAFEPNMGLFEDIIENVLVEHLTESHPEALDTWMTTGKLQKQ